MQAVLLTQYGSNNEVLQLSDVAMPVCGADDVLVKNHAASLNPLDYKIRDGLLKAVLPPTFPKILGHDLSGEVVQVGANVTDFKIGDAVFARIDQGRSGTLAEYTTLSASAVALKPAHLSHVEAASLPLVALTSWQALVDIAQLKAGQKVFIPAGSGGVGSIAIQIAKSLGAFVATNTSGKNLEWVKSLGADVVIDYTVADFSKVLHDYDVVYDTMGGETLTKSFSILKRGGCVVSIAAKVPSVDAAQKLGLNKIMQTVLWLANRPFTALSKKYGVKYHYFFMKANGKQLAHIGELTIQGLLKPQVDQVFALPQYKAAFDAIESGRARGKIVVTI